MKTYHGVRQKNVCTVSVRCGCVTRPLPRRREVRDHSKEFDWGQASVSSAQLALALAYDALGDQDSAIEVYQDLKAWLVAGICEDVWMLTRDQIVRTCERILESRLRDAEVVQRRARMGGPGQKDRSMRTSSWYRYGLLGSRK